MEKLVAYKRMPVWNKNTMPEAVQRKHNTKVGTWGKITVLKGALKFIELTEEGEVIAEHLFEAGADNPMAQPQAWHRVEAATDDVEWYLEFYCKPEDYFPKKYNTNPVHSEVLEAMQTVKPCKALDLGCGQGRNALFLAQHGFDVTAVDQNELSLEMLQSIVEQETKGTGMTLVPLKVYIKDGYAKLLLGLAKGKHDYDKRESIKRREQDRDIARVMKAVNHR